MHPLMTSLSAHTVWRQTTSVLEENFAAANTALGSVLPIPQHTSFLPSPVYDRWNSMRQSGGIRPCPWPIKAAKLRWLELEPSLKLP